MESPIRPAEGGIERVGIELCFLLKTNDPLLSTRN